MGDVLGDLRLHLWAHMGFYMLILLAGLQAIPADLYEAAQMDRASPWRTLTRVTLPLLLPNLLVVLVLALPSKRCKPLMKSFVLTGGGPGSATTFIVQFIYQRPASRTRCGCTVIAGGGFAAAENLAGADRADAAATANIQPKKLGA